MSEENSFFNPLSDEIEEIRERKKSKREERIEWLMPLGRKLWAENLLPTQIVSDLATEAQGLFNVSLGTAREYAQAAYRLLQSEASQTRQ